MHRLARLAPPPPATEPGADARPLGPGARWLVWCLVQAVLALALSQGLRAGLGPLHVHDLAGTQAMGATASGQQAPGKHASGEHWTGHAPGPAQGLGLAARHLHGPDEAGVPLEPEIPSAESWSTAQTSTAAALGAWVPVQEPGALAPPQGEPLRGRPASAVRWQDAELAAAEKPPRG